MRKLIIILLLFASCKKEETTTPIQTTPIVVTPQPKSGSVIFYIQDVPGVYQYGTTNVKINGIDKGNINMIPSGWIPSCGTQGWGITYTDTLKTFPFHVTVSNSTHNYTFDSTFTIKESCQSIRIYYH